MARKLARKFRSSVSLVCSLAVACQSALPAIAAAELSRATYENCAAQDEAGLKAALATISADALKTSIGRLDYKGLVGDAWRKNSLDEIIDTRVDIAVEEVKNETSWADLIKSLGNTEVSQKIATDVAERVYRSEAVKGALENLAGDVSKNIGTAMEGATADSAAPVLDCLKAFVGPRYGSAIATAVAGDAGKDLNVDPTKGAGEPTAGAVLKQSGEGIAGATILIVRRQLANLATRVGQRIAGSVLSRLVSVAVGGIGLVLIAKDIWELRNGVLPIIAAEMKAKATKEKVQEEVATEISGQIGEHVKEIAAASAEHIAEIWQNFKRAHAMVLRLADGEVGFRGFLDGVKPDRLARVDEIVSLLVTEEGEESVTRRLTDGTLNEAVHIMPDKAVEIARETRSVAAALGWTAIAGENLDAVVEYDIHRRAKPGDFTRQSLARVLSLQDRAAITRMAAVPSAAREILFGLQASDLSVLAKNLSETELTTLASYLEGLAQEPRERVLRAVATSPSKMQVLALPRVRDAIIGSADQGAAVGMMLETQSGFSPRVFAQDALLAAEGKVSPWLVWDKHPLGVFMLGALLLMLVLWLGRLFRRPGRAGPPAEGAA